MPDSSIIRRDNETPKAVFNRLTAWPGHSKGVISLIQGKACLGVDSQKEMTMLNMVTHVSATQASKQEANYK